MFLWKQNAFRLWVFLHLVVVGKNRLFAHWANHFKFDVVWVGCQSEIVFLFGWLLSIWLKSIRLSTEDDAFEEELQSCAQQRIRFTDSTSLGWSLPTRHQFSSPGESLFTAEWKMQKKLIVNARGICCVPKCTRRPQVSVVNAKDAHIWPRYGNTPSPVPLAHSLYDVIGIRHHSFQPEMMLAEIYRENQRNRSVTRQMRWPWISAPNTKKLE